MPGTKQERSPGKWTLTVTLGTDYTGKKKRYNKTFHGTATEANKELAVFYADCVRGKISQGSTLTIKEIVSDYITNRPQGSIKKTTIEGYEKILRCWIGPYVGNLVARKVSPHKLQGWVNELSQRYSPKTVHATVGLLSASYERMIFMDELAVNPCKKLSLPKKERREAEYYDEKESALFLTALQNMPAHDIGYKVLFELAILCGLRKSELLGLEVQDVDLNRCTVTVRQGRHRTDGGGSRLDTPKTAKSRRTISFAKEIRQDIIRLLSFYSEQSVKLGDEWNHSEALFRGPWGNPIDTTAPLRRLHKLQDENGLKRITLHQLRHTNVSIMISMGLDLKTIQERGGYSNSNTPLNIYGHLFKKEDEKVANEIYSRASSG